MQASAQPAELTWVPLGYVPAAAVRDAARELPPELRTVLYLTDVAGLSYGQAARVMDTSAGMVAASVRRARGWLRAALGPAILAAAQAAAGGRQAR